MNSKTIHKIFNETAKRVRDICKGITPILNSGYDRNDEFKEFFGIWNEKNLNEFEKKTVSLNTINQKDWV